MDSIEQQFNALIDAIQAAPNLAEVREDSVDLLSALKGYLTESGTTYEHDFILQIAFTATRGARHSVIRH